MAFQPQSIRQLALTNTDAERMIAFAQHLIQTPSLSAQENTVAEVIGDQLSALGFPDVRVDAMGNVIAAIGDGDGPTVLYDAHMDTVAAHDEEQWTHPPTAGVIENGVLYGLGAADMKGPLASMVYGAAQLLPYQDQLNGRLVLAFVVQEEPCEGLAIRHVIENEGVQPDVVLLGKPTDMQISRGQRGRVMFRVLVEGLAAHGALPERGRNAIYSAARLVFAIQLLALDLPNDPFLGPGTIAVTGIESRGASLNAIPDQCRVYVDRRLTLGETVKAAQAQLESTLSRENIPATVEITTYDEPSYTGLVHVAQEAHPAWVLDRAHPLVTTLARTIQSVRGATPQITHWPFSTDGVYTMGQASIPTVGFGPGDPALAHTNHEHVRLDDLRSAAQVYAGLGAALLLPQT